MAHDKNGSALLCNFAHLAEAFFLKRIIANGKDFIQDENFRVEISGDRECQAYLHAARIALDRNINESFHLGELDNLIEIPVDLRLLHSKNGAVEINIFSPGQFGMKTGTHLQERPDPT